MTDNEVSLATTLSPMELTERNKEYAITTLGALAELFIEDYEAKEGRIVPITDAPGVSAIVNALRSLPSMIMIIITIPLGRAITGQGYGANSCIIALAISCIPMFARLVSNNMFEVSGGKIEAARSAFVAPSLIRGWISVLAKTPHRAAMG